jgi:hypothetical protein
VKLPVVGEYTFHAMPRIMTVIDCRILVDVTLAFDLKTCDVQWNLNQFCLPRERDEETGLKTFSCFVSTSWQIFMILYLKVIWAACFEISLYSGSKMAVMYIFQTKG